MSRIVYDFVFRLLLPFIFLRLLWRAFNATGYARDWGQRFGFAGRARRAFPQRQWIWIHAVSIGEVNAAAPLIQRLRSEQPEYGIVVSTTTPTGSARLRELFDDDICRVYAPYDYSGAVRRFVAIFRPALLILVETELWPNFIYHSRKNGARVMVVNARLSEKSCRGYARLSTLSRLMLEQVNCIAAQTEDDGARFLKLGLPPDRLRVTGSVKFDIDLPATLEQDATALGELIGKGRPVWIAASTREGEESKVLRAFGRCLRTSPNLLLILVPRHPERFRQVEKLCREQHLRVVLRSSGRRAEESTQVFLGDSMGELLAWYSNSDVAFIGGSLVKTGCQNVLEPAALGVPVLAGPSQFNFQAICRSLEEAGALETVTSEEQLAERVIAILEDAVLRARMGEACLRHVRENAGAVDRSYALIVDQLG